MKVSKNFIESIAKFFYDKTIFILEKIEQRDNEGAITFDVGSIIYQFKGNVNYQVSQEIQKEYGLDYQIDIVITTDCNQVKIGDLVSYEDVVYSIKDVKVRDSHCRLVGSKYESRCTN